MSRPGLLPAGALALALVLACGSSPDAADHGGGCDACMCVPGTTTCEGAAVTRCSADGRQREIVTTCAAGLACRAGACVDLCARAAAERSHEGCELWPVDLDNAGAAASGPYAVLVVNPQPDVAAEIVLEEDDAAPGEAARLRTVATVTVGPGHREVLAAGPREVDGAPDGATSGGGGTALGRRAYRLRASVPVTAVQWNPLAAETSTGGAALLLPASGTGDSTYVIAGWPQTRARTASPDTSSGLDLRTFLTLVGTVPETQVHVETTARVIPGGPFPAGIAAGGAVDLVLQPFEVLNLETGDFGADFTGSKVTASSPLAVYTGSEASDAPFSTTAPRSCCAGHLEVQIPPVEALGRRYLAGPLPSRSRAIAAAGASLAPFAEPTLFRVVATHAGTTVETTLPAPWDVISLAARGASATFPALADFELDADAPVLLAAVAIGRDAAGLPAGLPGGGPSLLVVPPAAAWQSAYVFATPDTMAFDFVVVTAPAKAEVRLDGRAIDGAVCEAADGGELTVYRCPLSAPIVDPATGAVRPGRQDDGVHVLEATAPIGALVYGFDANASYAYPAGTRLAAPGGG